MAAKKRKDPREKRKNPKSWVVPGYILEQYIESGEYGHAFSAKDSEGNEVVVKVYDPSPDAMQDLKRIAGQRLIEAGIQRKPTNEEIEAELENVLNHECMKAFGEQLNDEERECVLLPSDNLDNIRRAGIIGNVRKPTHGTVSMKLAKIISRELESGRYSSFQQFVPLIKDVALSAAVFHREREDPSTGKKVRRTHNDIKPTNIGINLSGRAVLFDCGMATTYSSQDRAYSNCCALPIRAPELKPVGDKPNPRTDIWQLGCFMYTLAAGNAPVEMRSRPAKGEDGRDAYEAEHAEKIDRDIARARALIMGLPLSRTFAGITWKCLDKNPENRYADAEELVQDIDANMERILGEFMEAEAQAETVDGIKKREMVFHEKGEPGDTYSAGMLDLYSSCSEEDEKIIKNFGSDEFYPEGSKVKGLTIVPVNPDMISKIRFGEGISYLSSHLWFAKRKPGRVWVSRSYNDIFGKHEGAVEFYVGAEMFNSRGRYHLARFIESYRMAEAFHEMTGRLDKAGFYRMDEREQEEALEQAVAESKMPENAVVVLCPPGYSMSPTKSKKALDDIVMKYGYGIEVYVGDYTGHLADAGELSFLMKVERGIPANMLTEQERRDERQFIIGMATTPEIARAVANEYARGVAQ